MTILELKELEGYPYVAVGIYESAIEGKPVWVAGNSFIKLSDGRTFIKKGKLGKNGRWLKDGYDEFLVAANSLYELSIEYKSVPDFMEKGDYRERILF